MLLFPFFLPILTFERSSLAFLHLGDFKMCDSQLPEFQCSLEDSGSWSPYLEVSYGSETLHLTDKGPEHWQVFVWICPPLCSSHKCSTCPHDDFMGGRKPKLSEMGPISHLSHFMKTLITQIHNFERFCSTNNSQATYFNLCICKFVNKMLPWNSYLPCPRIKCSC